MGYNNLFIMLVTTTTIVSYINYKYIKIPKAIFLTVSSALLSIFVSIMAKFMPNEFQDIYRLLSGINFRTTILDVMLGYLLFASSLRINTVDLKKELGAVCYLASLGVILSTGIIGALLWKISHYLSINLPFSDCLIFGALISPTDAISIISVFKVTKSVPKHIQTRIIGEALFNDAIGIVLLIALVQIFHSNNNFVLSQTVFNLFQEVFGGLFWGFLVGKVTSAILKRIDANELTILATLTTASLGYVIAQHIHVSAVISIVVAGLYVGGRRRDHEFTKITSIALNTFWELVDDILNGFLFVLIGLEMLTVKIPLSLIIIGILSVLIIFIARYISILLPDLLLIRIFKIKIKELSNKKERILMSWGGVRGGISIALAWSIDNISPGILSITYVVVVSSILLQGSTLKYLTEKLFKSSL